MGVGELRGDGEERNNNNDFLMRTSKSRRAQGSTEERAKKAVNTRRGEDK